MSETVTVQYLHGHAYSQLLTAGRHAAVSDEPSESGGDDLGPSPYELLLWALGSCTSMTLMMYAQRHEWPLDDVSVTLTHSRVHADDSASAEGSGAKIDVMTREISLAGALTDEQRERLMAIASRCPVHKTLAGEVRVVDTMVADNKGLP